MQLQFSSELDYQQEAIKAITDIFEGQEILQSTFSVPKNSAGQASAFDSDLGVGNRLRLLEEEILENIQRIQLRNGLAQSRHLNSKDFTIEMETGTGKTYVYLRSIFELNRLYGFTKFIIVVPSIAIKEGTNKTLEITKSHFKGIYQNVNYDFFTYDSARLEQVRSFATNDYIQIMVINIDAFRKSFSDPDKENKANIIHRDIDKMNGYKPIDYIRSTNPIVIIDEPQSVDTTPKSKEAIESLNPLCTLRYSATHREKYHLLFKLDSVDAYERKLVKQIEVASLEIEGYHNKAYIKLLKVDNKISPITAQIEVDAIDKKSGKVERTTKKVKQNDDLEEITKRQVYSGYIVKDIYCEKDNEYIDFTSQPEILKLHHSIGAVDEGEQKRKQISKTIEEHLDKEISLNPKGIKVLSLFFIDKVANYRVYDQEGNETKGKYALMFEQEYLRLIRLPKYKSLFQELRDVDVAVEQVHNGYFSIDKKGKAKDSSGSTQEDNDTYNLIMRDKEKLLDFNSKLRFIFSHSALKEGWDNPNVFQICTLTESNSEIDRRQKIGRGLRLCVNQDGERVYGHDINVLTVMANESFHDFAEGLQKEIERDLGIRFGYVESHTFANIVIGLDKNKPQYLGNEKSEEFYDFLLKSGFVDLKGKVQDELRKHLRDNTLEIPESLALAKSQIVSQLKKLSGNLNIKDAGERKRIPVNKERLLSPEFKELWDKIKYKTTFSVKFDGDQLIEKCAHDIKVNLVAGKAKWKYSKAKQEITQGGIQTISEINSTSNVEDRNMFIPDIISYLQNETHLTRKSIAEILVKSGRLDSFKANPQKFIDGVVDIIRTQMRHFIVDGIKYKKIGNDHYYAQELFQNEELFGHFKKNMIESKKSPYSYVVYDSEVESKMAQSFEISDNVKVYAKLPSWFKIETPLGSYNPDWAVLWEENGNEKLYFVVETKGAISWEFLRPVEKGKIECGKKHFDSLGEGVVMEVAADYEMLREKISTSK